MKSLACLLIFAGPAIGVCAQDVFSNQTSKVLQQVIGDYPNQFSRIRGEQIGQNRQGIYYASKLSIQGSTHTRIVRFPNERVAWVCELFSSRDYNQASDKFREYYTDLKNTILKIEGQQPFILSGKFENPSETRKATSIVFDLLPGTGEIGKLKVEVQMEQNGRDWKIRLSVAEAYSLDLAIEN